jgi:hypothetical protein
MQEKKNTGKDWSQLRSVAGIFHRAIGNAAPTERDALL